MRAVRCAAHGLTEDTCVELLRLGMSPADVARATKSEDGAEAKLAETREAIRMEARA
jgi:hypothetical protein